MALNRENEITFVMIHNLYSLIYLDYYSHLGYYDHVILAGLTCDFQVLLSELRNLYRISNITLYLIRKSRLFLFRQLWQDRSVNFYDILCYYHL